MSLLHLRHQGANLATMGRVAIGALGRRPRATPPTPGPEFSATVPPLPQRLRDDFVRWCGGDPAAFGAKVPPWMFPQWGLPHLARTLDAIPWKVQRVVNQGCRVEIRGPLPADAPLQVTAQLVGIEETERRARLHQRLTTGPASQPDAVVADVFAVVPLARGPKGAKREPPTVPDDHTRLAPIAAHAGDGWRFALLTGDFNPIHWIGLAGKAAGFGGVILHGFGILARVAQALNDDSAPLSSLDVRFVRPLRLPADVSLFTRDDDGAISLAVGEAPGATARMLGTATR